LAGAAALSIGFFLGYVAFRDAQPGKPAPQQRPAMNDLYTGISNIQFLDLDAINGEVDITYDQVRPVRLRTSVNDRRVQDVLAYALLNDDNPGVRLRAISAFESDQVGAPPEEMKQAFLEALTSDPNAGVRLQALLVLRKLPFDEDVKSTLLFVLSHDENPGIRIAVMNYLAEITLEGIMPEQEMYDILRAKMAVDRDNSARSRPVNDI
ncbi:MAG: HEAT repeat domain-containing protein, partial [Candidatus Krumholzibacteria bacterium]|nr:HEAT repeat domain-containing protein [Candidatus Krumholzibacteria bacterium]